MRGFCTPPDNFGTAQTMEQWSPQTDGVSSLALGSARDPPTRVSLTKLYRGPPGVSTKLSPTSPSNTLRAGARVRRLYLLEASCDFPWALRRSLHIPEPGGGNEGAPGSAERASTLSFTCSSLAPRYLLFVVRQAVNRWYVTASSWSRTNSIIVPRHNNERCVA